MFVDLAPNLRAMLLCVVAGRFVVGVAGGSTLVTMFGTALVGAPVDFAFGSRRAGFAKAPPYVLYLLGGFQLLVALLNLHPHPWTFVSALWGGLAMWTAYLLKQGQASSVAQVGLRPLP